jgi:syntaxin 1B/2/3
LTKLKENISQVEILQKEVFATGIEEKLLKLNQGIDKKRIVINENLTEIRNFLKDLEDELTSQEGIMSKSEFRMKQGKFQSVCKRFINFLKYFEENQQNYQKKQRLQLQRQYLVVNSEATSEELEAIANGDEKMMNLTSERIFSMHQKLTAKKILKDMQDRQEEMVKIEKGVQELSKLILDMNFLVKRQCDLIIRIDEHIEGIEDDVENAKNQVFKGVERAKSKFLLKWILTIIIVIILFLFLVWIYANFIKPIIGK